MGKNDGGGSMRTAVITLLCTLFGVMIISIDLLPLAMGGDMGAIVLIAIVGVMGGCFGYLVATGGL